jgi:hypothetical protein
MGWEPTTKKSSLSQRKSYSIPRLATDEVKQEGYNPKPWNGMLAN